MLLSIIIVNYNVKYFLEHCLISVLVAAKNFNAEIIVVDNASSDESVTILQQQFPKVITIANDKNVGFAAANNQALSIAKGNYVLFLNPDMILPEDCLEKTISYLQKNEKVGALGVRLIDGKGIFLPESKRGFPSISTAFYKLSGISSILKKSKTFNQYHLGFLPQNQTNVVDVLPGCFMMMPTFLAKQLGGFSEEYFMYGEDIDLSYCVQKAGFQNIYFAEISAIHYKGESTKKGSLNYVKLFYNAMLIFAKRHLKIGQQKLFSIFINIAIVAKGTLSFIGGLFNKILLPILDALTISSCLWYTKKWWIANIKPDTQYANETVLKFFIAYILIWIISLFFSGGYDTPLRKKNIAWGMGIGVLISVAIYGLLPESMRFSRGITVLGASTSLVCIYVSRYILQLLGRKNVQAENSNGQHIITIANEQQQIEIYNLLQQAGVDKAIVGNVSPLETYTNNMHLGAIQNIQTIANTYQAREIIFAYPSVTFTEIISWMQTLGSNYNYKIHAAGTTSIIGSNSKNTAGDLYATDWHFNITKPSGKRNKRVFDVLVSVALFITYPVGIFIWKRKNILQNCLTTLLGKTTWVGYTNASNNKQLPFIKKSIFSIANQQEQINTNALNLQYARSYTTNLDAKIVWQQLFKNNL